LGFELFSAAILGAPIAGALNPPTRDANSGLLFRRHLVVQGAMAAHLAGLLQAAGASSTAAIAAAALVGPAQVGARLVEFGLLRSFHPIASARLASVLHPIGAVFVVPFGAPGVVAFALLHGAGNGLITIAKGTLPPAMFGPHGYGLRSGLLSAPARVLQSASPFLFGLLLDRVGIGGWILRRALPRRLWLAVPATPARRSCAPDAAGDPGFDHVHGPKSGVRSHRRGPSGVWYSSCALRGERSMPFRL